MADFSFGTDPEFMLVQDGRLVSAIGVVAPDRKTKHKHNGHLFYYDNVLAEIAVRPGNSKDQALYNIWSGLDTLRQIIWPAEMIVRSSAEYPAHHLRHKDARRIGCKEEYCAYEMDEAAKPEYIILKTGFRSAGGHIHVGGSIPALQQLWQKSIFVKMMDLFVGIPSIMIDHDPTSGPRRKLYGQAGRHRNKDYGVEYRSLSNFWLATPALAGLIYDLTAFVVDFCAEGRHLSMWSWDLSRIKHGKAYEAFECTAYDWRGLVRTINTSDKNAARNWVGYIAQYLPKELCDRIYEESTPRKLPDFYQAWGLR